ncbi:mannose-1-phosphate guanylyltransferase/mannose-6-phosphate isomerase [Candidatus Acidulodesulfobacterium sp. H_13]|uniref:mannose-1-phosphate guanylyltransferase/mannose-6-phosphate isomerase n=1 Tax=Candidatus Acidulodesulfobacterium sp. H_13 TaxID=3395470 RepID=UPI003AF96D27
MTNVVLCGGSGTRLWPISRTYFPKQFYKLIGNISLFQTTILRNAGLCDDFLIITSKDQYFIALDQLEEIGVKNFRFILEPVPRNTAAAVALSCFDALANNSRQLFVTPSDHLIKNKDAYKNVTDIARDVSEEGNIVMFGIKPAYPETGYGYIETAPEEDTSFLIARVTSFKEKPDKDTASCYISKGNFCWNSGMLLFKPEVLLKELSELCPDIYESSMRAYENAVKEDSKVWVGESDMSNIREDSIDFALLEKTGVVKVIYSDIDWSDLGNFDSIYNELEKDENNNVVTATEDILSINSKNNLIMSNGRMVATIDVEDLIVVNTDDALLISKKGSSQNVKKVVDELKKRNSELRTHHLTVCRPWGSYTVLLESNSYKIKKITVKPSAKLSLQKHFHRSEHWIVTSGTALVRVDDKEIFLKLNESTYIPIGSVHRLENPGLIPLIIIEAQVGEYLKEDDIVRLEDDYDR